MDQNKSHMKNNLTIHYKTENKEKFKKQKQR